MPNIHIIINSVYLNVCQCICLSYINMHQPVISVHISATIQFMSIYNNVYVQHISMSISILSQHTYYVNVRQCVHLVDSKVYQHMMSTYIGIGI